MKTKVRVGPVTVPDFDTMEIDWSNHIDHAVEKFWHIVLEHSVTIGLWVEDELVIILGLCNEGEGVNSVFVISSVHVRKREIQRLMLKYADQGMHHLTQVYKPHRLQAIVNPNNAEHVAFIKHFGFVYEGTLRDYTPAGMDVDMYGKSLRRA